MYTLDLAISRFAALPPDGRASLVFALLIALALVLAALPARRRAPPWALGARLARVGPRRARPIAA